MKISQDVLDQRFIDTTQSIVKAVTDDYDGNALEAALWLADAPWDEVIAKLIDAGYTIDMKGPL